MGRKRTKGNRSPSGRLKKATTALARQKWDHGNEVVQRRRALFDCMKIKNGKAVDEVGDGVGQLWAVGLLDGHGFEDDALRDVARLYELLHKREYGECDYKMQTFERADRSYNTSWATTPKDVLFEKFNDTLPAGTFEQMAVYELAIINKTADTLSPWIKAVVDFELVKLGRIPEAMAFPTTHDRGILNAAIRGLCALLDAGLAPRFQVRQAA